MLRRHVSKQCQMYTRHSMTAVQVHNPDMVLDLDLALV